MRQPESISSVMAGDPTFGERDGMPIVRERVCACGRRFTQRQLSERFLTIVANQSKRAIDVLSEQIPGFFVPVHCPPCERRDLGHRARLDEMQHRDELHTHTEKGHAA